MVHLGLCKAIVFSQTMAQKNFTLGLRPTRGAWRQIEADRMRGERVMENLESPGTTVHGDVHSSFNMSILNSIGLITRHYKDFS